jgi:hypothetical protein
MISSNNNNDGLNSIGSDVKFYDSGWGGTYPMNLAYVAYSTGTPLYAKARSYGATSTINIGCFAIRMP